MSTRRETFLSELKAIVGESEVQAGPAVDARYGTSTTGVRRAVSCVAFPTTAAQVQRVVALAVKHEVAIHPVSSGKNWGYGCASATRDLAVVLDLSKMNRIIAVDRELGTVTIEPGVTQGQLGVYLDEYAPELMVPVTGAGPSVSLLGNALERGYGITPHTDHFAAVMRVKAVLADGTPYVSALEELGGTKVGSLFRWGIGPNVDGLFSQGSLGVVTEATIALARRPERVEAFFFNVTDDEGLEAAVNAVRTIMRECSGAIGGMNLIDRPRSLAMRAPYPHDEVPAGQAMSAVQVKRLGQAYGIPAWTGFGGLYGTNEMVRAARKSVRRALRGVGVRLMFVTSAKLRAGAAVARWIPGSLGMHLRSMIATATETVRILEGRPSEVALPLAYWKSPKAMPAQGHDPQRDGCGLLWHAPLVPLIAADARKHVELVRAIAREHQMEAPITLTALSERCFDSTVPLLFDRADAEQVDRARRCQHAMLERGCAEGFVPYRLGTHQMDWFTKKAPTATALIDRLSRSVDAEQLLSPGRYRASPRPPQLVDRAI